VSWLDGLAAELAGAGLGLAWSPGAAYGPGVVGIVVDDMPAQPAEVVALFGYEGDQSSSLLEHDTPRLQVRVRGTADPSVSRDRCQRIYDFLHGFGPATLPDGTRIQLIVGRGSGPAGLGRDDAGRHEHVANFDVDVINPDRRGRS
jgi:hypothetical protein